jgi:hypothetical protein
MTPVSKFQKADRLSKLSSFEIDHEYSLKQIISESTKQPNASKMSNGKCMMSMFHREEDKENQSLFANCNGLEEMSS